MTVRPILRIPERVLKRRSDEIGSGDVDELFRDLVDTMRASPSCVGLAASQIGVARRALVVDVTGHPKTTAGHGLIRLVDPLVVEASGRFVGREGCMSLPDLTANVARATHLVVEGTGSSGEVVVIATEGFEARVLQHEIDHLEGLLILDRVASLETDVFARKVYR